MGRCLFTIEYGLFAILYYICADNANTKALFSDMILLVSAMAQM